MESAIMANASTPLWDSLMRSVFDNTSLRMSAVMGITTVAILLFLSFTISPHVDPSEPPVLKPTIPVVGHLVNMIRHGTMLLTRYRKYNLPVATLPVLNGKMYVIWDTTLVQGIFRQKAFSTEQFSANFVANMVDLDSHLRHLLHNTPLTKESMESIGNYLLKGESLRKINISAIRFIEIRLHEQFDPDPSSSAGDWVEIPNLNLWLRDTISLAGSHALWGARNPLAGDAALLDDFWAFESKILIMALALFPRITARRAYAGRARLQAALGAFYQAGHDESEDVSDLIREHARLFRRYDLSVEQIGKVELAVLTVALTNTAPTLFWLLAFIVSTPGLAVRVRGELESLLRREGDEATLDVARWDSRCPLLVSCYRETMRVTSTATVTRRVAEDTTLVGGNGRSYTIKAGVDVQVSGIASHTIPEVWGADAGEFDPERFLPFVNDPGAQHVREKKSAFHPFGGGRHVCPGRNFAFTEILTFVAVLLLGYDIEPGKGAANGEGETVQWKKPPARTQGSIAEATAKPVNNGEGYDARIRRKPGWEKVRWHFEI